MIHLINGTTQMKHGTAIVGCPVTGVTNNLKQESHTYYNKPTVTELINLYSNRFDDSRYYSGDAST